MVTLDRASARHTTVYTDTSYLTDMLLRTLQCLLLNQATLHVKSACLPLSTCEVFRCRSSMHATGPVRAAVSIMT